MVCALFSFLSPDYGNLITGFRVPTQPRNSLLFHSLDPEASLVRGQLLRHKQNMTLLRPVREAHLLPAAACHVSDLQRERFLRSERWSLYYKKISGLEDKR